MSDKLKVLPPYFENKEQVESYINSAPPNSLLRETIGKAYRLCEHNVDYLNQFLENYLIDDYPGYTKNNGQTTVYVEGIMNRCSSPTTIVSILPTK